MPYYIMKKFIPLLLAIIFLASAVSAHHYVHARPEKYYPVKIDSYYEKHYTIQTSDFTCVDCKYSKHHKKDYSYADYHERNKFLMKHRDADFKDFLKYRKYSRHKYGHRDSHKHDYKHNPRDKYYIYNEATKTLEKKDCYHYPPKGSIFYIKCP